MNKIMLDFNQFSDGQAVHDFLREALREKEYYGSNLDALYDVLTTTHQEVLIYMNRVGKPFEEGFVRVFLDAAKENYRVNVYGSYDIHLPKVTEIG